ncbi:MAG: M28 family metallopeptidase [Bacteriovoracaceae bacterium]
MKNIFLFLTLFPTYSIAVLPLKTNSVKPIEKIFQIKMEMNKIEQKEVVETLRSFIKSSKPNRLMGTPGHTAAVNFIGEFIQANDPHKTGKVSVQEFSPDIEFAQKFYNLDFKLKVEDKFSKTSAEYKNWKSFTDSMLKALKDFKKVKGQNIVWEKKGTTDSDQVIIVGASYDTLNINAKTNMVDLKGDMPGADKNGTGVVTLLYLIKELAKYDLKNTVRVVFLDYQGLGFLGAKSYVEELQNEVLKAKTLKIMGFIGVEMVGNDSKVFDKEQKLGNMCLYYSLPGKPLYAKENEMALNLSRIGKEIASDVTFKPMGNGFEYSDNIMFQEAGIPSLVYSQNWETDFNSSRYHTPDDFVETINQHTFHKSVQSINAGVLSMALNVTK